MTLNPCRSNSVTALVMAALSLPVGCLRPPELAAKPGGPVAKPTESTQGVPNGPELKITATRTSESQNGSLRVSINASNAIRTIKKEWFLGTNIAIWNQPSTFTSPEVLQQFRDAGIGLIRMPGGSASDQYFWNGNGVLMGNTIDRSKYKNGTWKVDYSKWAPGFMGFFGFPKDPAAAQLNNWHGNSNVKHEHDFIKALHADTLVTVNAGTGTPADAAEWVKWASREGYDV